MIKKKVYGICPFSLSEYNIKLNLYTLDAITKYIKYENCEEVVNIHINQYNTHKDLFAYQNKLYLSEITHEENQKIQTVRGLKAGEVSFKIEEIQQKQMWSLYI